MTYWYGLPAPSLIQTDELKIGHEESEKQHQYKSPEASAPYEVTSRYEWGPDTLQGKEIYPPRRIAGAPPKRSRSSP